MKTDVPVEDGVHGHYTVAMGTSRAASAQPAAANPTTTCAVRGEATLDEMFATSRATGTP
jgi:hypothetical protein